MMREDDKIRREIWGFLPQDEKNRRGFSPAWDPVPLLEEHEVKQKRIEQMYRDVIFHSREEKKIER